MISAVANLRTRTLHDVRTTSAVRRTRLVVVGDTRTRLADPLILAGARFGVVPTISTPTTLQLPHVPDVDTEQGFFNGVGLLRVPSGPLLNEYALAAAIATVGLPVIPSDRVWFNYFIGLGLYAPRVGLDCTGGPTVWAIPESLVGPVQVYADGGALFRLASAPQLGECVVADGTITLGGAATAVWVDGFVVGTPRTPRRHLPLVQLDPVTLQLAVTPLADTEGLVLNGARMHRVASFADPDDDTNEYTFSGDTYTLAHPVDLSGLDRAWGDCFT